MYKEESLQLLRQRIDLAEVLSTHLDLKRSGSSYKALCPFHEEKTPSFIVHKGDTHYHCFGCGAHGDAIAFLMSHLKMSFADAVQSLAERFQVSLESTESTQPQKGPNKALLREVLREAKRFYHFYLLHTEEGHEALQYLYQRGLDLEFIHLFEIGLSPKQSGLLQKVLAEKHFEENLMEEAGLFSRLQGGSKREFFLSRVMFPIKDALGQVVGFSARKIKEDTFGPKYLNTPETPLFKKSHILFGLSECRKRIAKEKKALLVEGQIDALRLIQEGFTITVAGQGTAFTEEHAAELIKLGVQEVFIAFDGDEAGKQAAIKVGDIFQKEGIDVRVVFLGDKEDPDSFLRSKGPEAFTKALDNGVNYLQFLVEQYSTTIPVSTPSGKHQLVQAITKRVREWNHPLMIHESLRKLAQLLEVPENLIQEEKLVQDEVFIKKNESITKPTVDPDRVLEADFLRWLLLFGSKDHLFAIATLNILPEALKVPIAQKLYRVYIQEKQEGKSADLLSIGAQLEDAEGQLFLSEILQKRINGDKAKEGCIYTMQKILERNWLFEREEIRRKIHHGKCSEEEIYLLAKRFDELKKHPPQVKIETHCGS